MSYRGILSDIGDSNTLIKNLDKNFVFTGHIFLHENGERCIIDEPIVIFGNSNVKQYMFIYVKSGNCNFNGIELKQKQYIIIEYFDNIKICDDESFTLYYKSIYLCKICTDLILVNFSDSIRSNIYGLQSKDLKSDTKYKSEIKCDLFYYRERELNEDDFLLFWNDIYQN